MRAESFEELLDILQPAGGVLEVHCRMLMQTMAQNALSPQALERAHAEAQLLFEGSRSGHGGAATATGGGAAAAAAGAH